MNEKALTLFIFMRIFFDYAFFTVNNISLNLTIHTFFFVHVFCKIKPKKEKSYKLIEP